MIPIVIHKHFGYPLCEITVKWHIYQNTKKSEKFLCNAILDEKQFIDIGMNELKKISCHVTIIKR